MLTAIILCVYIPSVQSKCSVLLCWVLLIRVSFRLCAIYLLLFLVSNAIILCVVRLSVILPSVIMPTVILLSVVASFLTATIKNNLYVCTYMLEWRLTVSEKKVFFFKEFFSSWKHRKKHRNVIAFREPYSSASTTDNSIFPGNTRIYSVTNGTG